MLKQYGLRVFNEVHARIPLEIWCTWLNLDSCHDNNEYE